MKFLHTPFRQNLTGIKCFQWNYDLDANISAKFFDLSYLIGFLSPLATPYIMQNPIGSLYQEYLASISIKKLWNPPLLTISTQKQNTKPFWYYSSISSPSYHLLNSKVAWFHFLNKIGLGDGQWNIFHSQDELKTFFPRHSQKWLLKSNHGFSGRGHYQINQETYLEVVDKKILFPVVGERLLDRKWDFSIYYSPFKKFEMIYENHIDGRFQYKGTTIRKNNLFNKELFLNSMNLKNSVIDHFLNNYQKLLDNLPSFVFEHAPHTIWGGSLDSFVYENEDNHDLNLHPGCEFNFRRTMGLVTYLLWKNLFDCPEKLSMRFLSKEIIPKIKRSHEIDFYQYGLEHFRRNGKMILSPYQFSPILEIEL